jgi:SOS response regulatory protein OraA/RecX
MTDNETEIFNYAVKLLSRRDYSLAKLREKLQMRFGNSPDDVITQLISKRFVNDRRYAENYVAGRRKRGRSRLRDELLSRGIPLDIVEEVLSTSDWPSLSEVLKAKMMDWNMRKPLQPGDAARLFRAMARLGYEEEAIREEIQGLHEQQ